MGFGLARIQLLSHGILLHNIDESLQIALQGLKGGSLAGIFVPSVEGRDK